MVKVVVKLEDFAGDTFNNNGGDKMDEKVKVRREDLAKLIGMVNALYQINKKKVAGFGYDVNIDGSKAVRNYCQDMDEVKDLADSLYVQSLDI